MFLQYVDEAGCPGPLKLNNPEIQPVLSLVGVTFPQKHLKFLTTEFLDLKQQFYPKLCKSRHSLDWVKSEIKGSDLSRTLRFGPKEAEEHSLLFLGSLLNLVAQYEGRIQGKIYIKPPDGVFDGIAAYTTACQMLCSVFQEYLEAEDGIGIVIMDSRTQAQNIRVAHSIFTEKFKTKGDKYPRILEMPLFGQSNNHAGIQIADLINSALIYPMACVRYCLPKVDHPHIDPAFERLWDKFQDRIKNLQALKSLDSKTEFDGLKVVDVAGAGDNVLAFGARV